MSNTKEDTTVSKVVLGNYKGLEVNKILHEISDSMIDSEIGKLLAENSILEEVSDRAVQSGDTVTIDFEGFVEGVAFNGGKGENVELEIGSNTFIPGFETQILDKNVGDAFSICVTFPSEYGNSDLAGKDAVFETSVNKISKKSVPAADDDFAQRIANVPTISDLRQIIRERLQNMADDYSKEKMIDDMLAQIIDSSGFTITPEFIDEQAMKMTGEYSGQLQQRGWTLESYLEMNGQTMEQFADMIKVQAETRSKSLLAIEEISKEEGISVTDDDMEAEYSNIANMHNIPLEELRPRFRQEDNDIIKSIITSKKVFDYLLGAAKII